MTFRSGHGHLWAVAFAAAIFLPFGARAYRTAFVGWQLHSATIPSVPAHTVVLLETSGSHDLATQMTVIYARRGDASGVRIFRSADSFSPTGETETKVIQLTSGVFVNSSSDVGMKTTLVRDASDPMVKAHLLTLRDPGSNCTKNFSGRNPSTLRPISETMDAVEGYPALKTVDDSGDGVWTVWRAPAFGCDTVKQHVVLKAAAIPTSYRNDCNSGSPTPGYSMSPRS